MPDIKITGKKVLRTIHKEFQDQFPYLGLTFYTPDVWNTAREKGGTISPIPSDKKLAEVRTVPPPKDEKEISVHGRTLVKNLEDNFVKTYGLYAKVYFSKDDKFFYVSGDDHSLSLTQFNKKMEENGCKKKPNIDKS